MDAGRLEDMSAESSVLLPPPQPSSHRLLVSLGHKRTKSAGSYYTARTDGSLYTKTGLYGHRTSLVKTAGPMTNGLRHRSQRFSTSELNVSNVRPFEDSSRHCDHTLDSLRLEGVFRKSSLKVRTFERQQNLVPGGDEEFDHESSGGDCGLFSCRPTGLQNFATIQVFVFVSCVLVTLNQALSSGYFNSVITTIEKRFDIPSKMTGMIASTFELGNLPTVLFVSYFGTHRHIPTWIGKGALVSGLGSILFAVPHFLDINNPLDNVNISGPLDDNICHIPQPALHSPFAERASHFIPEAGQGHCADSGSYRSPHVIFFVLAMVLIGCGGTPIFTLGTTYIDDHVSKESSSMYIGCMYSTVAFGLVCGFLLGGYIITVQENSFGSGIVPQDIYPGHPKWIGAWWAGFILLGVLLILVSIPLFAFPKRLPKRETKNSPPVASSEQQPKSVTWEMAGEGKSTSTAVAGDSSMDTKSSAKDKSEYGRSAKEIPKSMWALLTNPVFMVTCLGACMELSIVNGFLVFLPKYLETQFTIGKSEANLFAGGIAVPGACVGIFLGGYLLKRFQLGIKGAIQFVLFFNLVCMGLYTALYFLGCDNMKMSGVTLPYYNSSVLESSSPFQVNLTADCNMGCRCSPNDIEPVCGRNGITYFSPCHAGCQMAGGPRHIQNYSNCACIAESHPEVTAVPIATAGPCPQTCKAMIPFLIILFVVTLVVSITQMPLLMITLRSVREEERAFALGMQFVIFRLFGYIPSPIIFGNVIDSTCMLWKVNCAKQGGFCLIYNIEHFRLRYVGVCSALKVAAALLFFLDWVLVSWSPSKGTNDSMSSSANKPTSASLGVVGGVVSASIISLDRLSVLGFERRSIEHLELLESASGSSPDSDYASSAGDDVEDESDGHVRKRAAAGPAFPC